MTKKRRNNGHRHRNCGKVPSLRCDGCNSMVAKDKAIYKNINKSIIEPSIINDIKKASVYDNYTIPKFHTKLNFCISCAVHRKLVHR
jgi:small subunit ribosomal protein S26e